MTKVLTCRLIPGDDIKPAIEKMVGEAGMRAGFVASCVAGLSELRLRMAGAKDTLEIVGAFEVVSITGTVCVDGCHVHMSAASEDGAVWGGHLMTGNIVRTTAEIVVIGLDDRIFTREYDAATGYKELVISESSESHFGRDQ